MLKAILFDMDGVLVDSEILHCNAAVETLNNLGIPATFDYCFSFVGTTTNKMMDIIIKDFSLSCTRDYLIEEYNKTKDKLLEEVGYDKVPYTKELIQSLHKEGYKLAIASSSPIESILYVTNTLGIHSYFDKLISGSNLKNPKPAPDIYLLAANELGVSPEECIVIEDSFHGVTAGKAAHMPVIGYINKNSGNQDLSKADMLIEGFEEVDSSFLTYVYNRFHKYPNLIGETQRILIRELVNDDIPHLYELLVSLYGKDYSLDILSDYNEFYKKYSSYIATVYHFYGYGLYGVFLRATGELIGRCGIGQLTINHDVLEELGYEIAPTYQQQGYGYEATLLVLEYAFHHLHLDSILCKIQRDNTPSIKLAQKIGMKQVKSIEEYAIYQIDKNCKGDR